MDWRHPNATPIFSLEAQPGTEKNRDCEKDIRLRRWPSGTEYQFAYCKYHLVQDCSRDEARAPLLSAIPKQQPDITQTNCKTYPNVIGESLYCKLPQFPCQFYHFYNMRMKKPMREMTAAPVYQRCRTIPLPAYTNIPNVPNS